MFLEITQNIDICEYGEEIKCFWTIAFLKLATVLFPDPCTLPEIYHFLIDRWSLASAIDCGWDTMTAGTDRGGSDAT